jgi:hypothetical protein
MDKNVYDEQNINESQQTTGLKSTLRWFFRLRGVALSIPVAVIAVILAVNNAANLPGALMIGAGRNVITIGRSVLIMGPLSLTALSILMTLFSKKVIYPWLISLFTLLLPLALLLTMSF